MKPVSLEFCGINSFSEPAKIDFLKLTEFGIFGIFGDTGSGKSTILDCIGFALYGNIARSRSGSIADVIHYASDKAYVHFEFEIEFDGARRTYRVERELKRKNAAQSLKVYEQKENSWLIVADGVKGGNALLERIIGLEQRDFEKCIALPQGEFAQFVRAARGERLKLISRLFDLEAYGEALVKSAGSKMTAAREDLAITQARLVPYRDISAQSIEMLRKEAEQLSEEEAKLGRDLSSLREQEKSFATRTEKRREQEKLLMEMERLQSALPRMQTLNQELDRMDKAASVLRASDDFERTSAEIRTCMQRVQQAEAARRTAQSKLSEFATWDPEKAEKEEVALTDLIARAKMQAYRAEECATAMKKLQQIETQLATERTLFSDFSYETERDALEKAIAALGSDDFLAYVEQFGKADLLRAEYATFAAELEALTEQYPVILPAAEPLVKKYKILSAGDKSDLQTIRASYEARQKERNRLQQQAMMLEKRKGRYDLHLQNLSELTRVRKETSDRIVTLSEGLENIPSISVLEQELREKRVERQRKRRDREDAQRAASEAEILYVSVNEQLNAAQSSAEHAQNRLKQILDDGGFPNVAEAKMLFEKYGDPAKARQRIEEYKQQYSAVRARLRTLSEEDLSDATPERYAAVKEQLSECEQKVQDCTRTLAVKREALARAETALKEKIALEKEFATRGKQFMLYERLRKLLEGNKFMEFVAEEYLQTVAINASNRLLSLTDGRYFLRYDSGFFVGDNFNGGNLRGVYTLSGGETFLVSLSLALALSAEICARSLRPIEFFFLDEGFGTLDERLIDTVMDSLERLKSENFSIGIISHVEELKHRIDRRLLVTKATERHGSQVRME